MNTKITKKDLDITKLKKKLIKEWGKKCKDYSALCCVCQIWRAFDVIESLYDTKYHLGKFK